MKPLQEQFLHIKVIFLIDISAMKKSLYWSKIPPLFFLAAARTLMYLWTGHFNSICRVPGGCSALYKMYCLHHEV